MPPLQDPHHNTATLQYFLNNVTTNKQCHIPAISLHPGHCNVTLATSTQQHYCNAITATPLQHHPCNAAPQSCHCYMATAMPLQCHPCTATMKLMLQWCHPTVMPCPRNTTTMWQSHCHCNVGCSTTTAMRSQQCNCNATTAMPPLQCHHCNATTAMPPQYQCNTTTITSLQCCHTSVTCRPAMLLQCRCSADVTMPLNATAAIPPQQCHLTQQLRQQHKYTSHYN